MDRPDWAPEGIDIERPSAARIYDYWLGGTHNFAIDREVAAAVTRRRARHRADHAGQPGVPASGRALPGRSGSASSSTSARGIPTLGNVHEVAQKAAPDARGGLRRHRPGRGGPQPAHPGRQRPRASSSRSDLRDVEADPEPPGGPRAARLRPADGGAHDGRAAFHPGHATIRPASSTRFRDALAPGSYLVISHGTAGRMTDEAEQVANETVHAHLHAASSAGSLPQVERAIRRASTWSSPVWCGRPMAARTSGRGGDQPERSAAYVGVGRKR